MLGGVLGQTVFVIVSLVILYFFYQYLFASTGLTSLLVLNGITAANPETAIVASSTDASPLPAIYEGGEYSVNVWIYINDWKTYQGRNKHIISVGGSDFLTLAMYLKPYANALAVTIRTTDTAATGTPGSSTPGDALVTGNLATLFGSTSTMPSTPVTDPPCDIPSIDLQKWVQITLALNNKTSDVYIDGKLARSCVLPSFYRVSKSNLKLKVCDYGGFGGYVSNVSAYNSALNPEEVWQLYMKGPGPTYSLAQYWKSLFSPKQNIQLGYPKMNVTG